MPLLVAAIYNHVGVAAVLWSYGASPDLASWFRHVRWSSQDLLKIKYDIQRIFVMNVL